MKKIIIGLVALSSISAFADTCRFDVWWIPQEDQGVVRSAKITFKDAFTEEQCRSEAELGAKSEYIIRVTDSASDYIVKTRYNFKSAGLKSTGTYKQGIWK
jgi:hypothetical protein